MREQLRVFHENRRWERGRWRGEGRSFWAGGLAGAGGDALGTTQLFPRRFFLSAGRKQLRDGLVFGFFLVLSDDILQCVTGLATTTVRDKGKDAWHEKELVLLLFIP